MIRLPLISRRKILSSALGAGLVGVTAPLELIAASNPSLTAAKILNLSQSLNGTLITPDMESYDGARRTFSYNPEFDKHPALIAACASESDVARAMLFARENELPLAVRSGGHDALAASTCDGGIIIDLQQLNTFAVSGDRVAVGPGLRAGQVDYELSSAGRALPLVCNPSVGMGGLTLGGGLGWFVGTQGAACDALRSARVVTVEGRSITASRDENEDLFWALKGGGGNFGIVTEFEFDTFAKPDVIAGVIVYDAKLLQEFLAFYQEFMATAPEELTVELVINDGETPSIAAMVYYSGDESRAESVLAPLRTFGPVLADGIRKQEYGRTGALAPDVAPYFQTPNETLQNEPRESGLYWQGISVSALTERAIQALDVAREVAPVGWSFGLGHVMRGAVTEVDQDSSPLIRPAGLTTVQFGIGWSHRSQAASRMQWIDNAIDSLQADASPHNYINYMSTDAPAAVATAYGENFARLARIKRAYDPDNVLNGNRNIVAG